LEVELTVVSSKEIERLALEAGFDLCGFARPEPIPPDSLVQWLEAGYDADMDWMGRRLEERLDVKRLLPFARTVVALASNHYRDDAFAEGSPIARYARGRDYHANLKDCLRRFRASLRERFGPLETYGSVDTGPFMEKVWASRAGIGYVGKNGCLITEKFGSTVNLAVLVIELEVDAYASGPAMDRCGTCQLCITSCPTDAIVPTGHVDARRCLSYQTIENEAAMPESLRLAMEGIVFGCDICQDVCPLNHRPIPAGDRFAPRAVAGLSVRDLAALTREQYAAWVPGTALGRAQYDGLRRNAAYALGAARDKGAVEVLRQLENDPAEFVREAARWALARLAQ
jgi:epoxyqueuosine reductase